MRIVVPLIAILALTACSVPAPGPSESATPAASPTSSAAAPSPTATPNGDWVAPDSGRVLDSAEIEAELPGYWTGDWGEMLFRTEDDGTVLAAYGFRGGLVFGQLEGQVLNGWWCEAPDYALPDRAGPVEMRLVEGAGGTSIDGRWKYTWSDDWNEDWDIDSASSSAPPAELEARLDDAHQLCTPQ